MAYEPLHHKYRPQTFSHLVGQEAIATTLTNAILSERIAPAYLFTGPRGTGKTSSARILAKSLNCKKQDKPTASPCGFCEVCHAIAVGNALDVIEIDAASNTGVDNIRDIIERSQFAPVQCRYKVYVIDECHMLSTAAFNSLLKTLEEPPDRVVFVLATTDPQRVLPTIISRCQRFDFRRIPLEAMVRHLQDIAIQENIKITPEAVTLVSQVAQGGLRDAESLLDQLSLLPQEVTVEAVWDLVGAVPERDLIALTKAIASDKSETVLEQCRRLMDRGREPLVVLQNLAGFYRDLLIAKTAPNRSDLVAVTAPTWEQLCNFAQQLEVASILQSQQHLKSSEAQIKNTTQPRLWLEVTLLGLLPSALPSNAASSYQGAPLQRSTDTGARNNTASSSVIQSKTAAKHPPETSRDSTKEPQQPHHSATPAIDASTTEVTPNQSQVPPEVVPVHSQPTIANPGDVAAQNAVDSLSQDLEQVWQEVVASVQMRSTQALLHQHGKLIAYEDAFAIISIPTKFLLKTVQNNLHHIEAAFQKVFNQKVKVSFQVGTVGLSSNSSNVNAPTSEGKVIDPKPQAGGKDTTTNNVAIDQTNQASLNSDSEASKEQSADREASKEPTTLENPNGSIDRQFSQLPLTPQEATSTPDEIESKQKDLAESFNGHTVPFQKQMASNRDSSSAMAIQSPRVPLTQGREWPDEEIEQALESLKKFFEGEIVELKDDFNRSEQASGADASNVATAQQPQKAPDVSTAARSQEVVELASEQLELEPKVDDSEAFRQQGMSPLLDFSSSDSTPGQESSQSNPPENGKQSPIREEWPCDEDGEPEF